MTAPPCRSEPGEDAHLHWWCRHCGRWVIVDDRDTCEECAFHMARLPGTAGVLSLARALTARLRRGR